MVRAIFQVHPFDFPEKLSVSHNIVVKLEEMSGRGQLRSGKFTQRMEVETIDDL